MFKVKNINKFDSARYFHREFEKVIHFLNEESDIAGSLYTAVSFDMTEENLKKYYPKFSTVYQAMSSNTSFDYDAFFSDLYFPFDQQILSQLQNTVTQSGHSIEKKLIDLYSDLLEKQIAAKQRCADQLIAAVELAFTQAQQNITRAKDELAVKKLALEIEVSQHRLLESPSFKQDKLNAVTSIEKLLNQTLTEVTQAKDLLNPDNIEQYPSLTAVNHYLVSCETALHTKIEEVKRDKNIFRHEGMGKYLNRFVKVITCGLSSVPTATVTAIDDASATSKLRL